MRSRALARAAVVAAAAALVVGVSAIPSSGQSEIAVTTVAAVSGHASGAFVDIEADPSVIPDAADAGLAPTADDVVADGVSASAFESFIVGPAPTVTLPPEGGGPFTDSLPSLELPFIDGPLQVAGPLQVSTEGATGPTGHAVSSARVEDFGEDTDTEGALGLVVDLVEVECEADLAGARGSTQITDGELLLLEPIEIPSAPDPNTIVFDDEYVVPGSPIHVQVRVVANEQTVGANDITVRGLHLTATASLVEVGGPSTVFETFDEIVGETACGVVPGAEIEPTFTG